ncbi:haloacid dehalogenase type II [Bacillus weihaiensis]|uniref:haloacid dehalogenase type II n=1 Tax=Bacillus weihaiensis TaxID=1547283 RepID=UPI0023536405|nr:haloacid dehalogenase type II [Bacillus weihaiensis]
MQNKDVIVFDVYGTLFDVHAVIETCEELFPRKGKQISELWRKKQLEYAFLRQLMGTYEPFSIITKEALHFACESLGVTINQESEDKLLNAYNRLKLFDEVEGVITSIQDRRLAVFSNGPFSMLEPLLEQSALRNKNIMALSVDDKKAFKPTPIAYQWVLSKLNVSREQVLFVSSNTWDIAGAKTFGFETAWVNRQGAVFDKLGVTPDYIIKDLGGLLSLEKGKDTRSY